MRIKKAVSLLLVSCLAVTAAGCATGNAKTGKESQVIIYSNADEEAVEAMKKALDGNGYEGK